MTSTQTSAETAERAFAFLRLNERPLEAAQPRRDRDPRPLLHAGRAPLPRGRARDDGRLRRHAQVRRRLVRADAARSGARPQRPLPRARGRGLDRRLPRVRADPTRATPFERYLEECRELGFDIVEISSGFVTLPIDDLVRLTKAVREAGLKPKPEVGIQFGAGGTSSVEALEAEGTRDVG